MYLIISDEFKQIASDILDKHLWISQPNKSDDVSNNFREITDVSTCLLVDIFFIFNFSDVFSVKWKYGKIFKKEAEIEIEIWNRIYLVGICHLVHFYFKFYLKIMFSYFAVYTERDYFSLNCDVAILIKDKYIFKIFNMHF